VYYKALCAENLISGFKSTGIFPKKSVISSLATKPSVSANNDTADETEPKVVKEIQSVVQVEETNDIIDLSVPEDFFESKVDEKLNHFEIKLLVDTRSLASLRKFILPPWQ